VILTILSVGKTSEPFLEEGVRYYSKKIQRFSPLEMLIVPEERISAKGRIEWIRKKEESRIRERIPTGSWIVGLDERGKALASRGLAALLERRMEAGCKRAVFIIGGPYGLSEGFRQDVHFLLSLSSMTLTHGMAKLFLLEQIYRAFTLLRGEPYHK
jgi:23S rRNA (pseudouridine1915-N3)-methyltransferase